MMIEGKSHNLRSRKYCLECSPFGNHNTVKIKEPREYKCLICGETDSKNFFVGRYTKCKKCRNMARRPNETIASQNTRISRKKRVIEYMGGCCACCGFKEGISAFDVHHINPENKDPNFSTHLFWSWERLKKELDSCLLLCANCHRRLHNGEISYKDFKYIPDSKLHLINGV